MDQEEPAIQQVTPQLSPEIEPRQVIVKLIINPGAFDSLEEAEKYIEPHFTIWEWKDLIAYVDVDWLRVADIDAGGVG